MNDWFAQTYGLGSTHSRMIGLYPNDWFAQTFGLGSIIHSRMIGLYPNDWFTQTYGLGSIDSRMIGLPRMIGLHKPMVWAAFIPNDWFGQHSFPNDWFDKPMVWAAFIP